MENKLISMVDFVLKVIQTPNVNEAICLEQAEKRLDKIYFYSLFLKQPLKLGMFVPCDENDVPLNLCDCNSECGYCSELEQYQETKDRVLFEGFEIDYDEIVKNGEIRIWFRKGIVYLNNTKNELKTIEDLVKYNLTLTASAIKQFEL